MTISTQGVPGPERPDDAVTAIICMLAVVWIVAFTIVEACR